MNQYLIDKLKEGRSKKRLKQSDVTKLTGIKNTTLSNYENGNTEPDMDTFLKLCNLYDLDYSEIIQEAYGYKIPGTDLNIKSSEIAHLKKYRALDDHGKEMVNLILDKECKRVETYGLLSDSPVRLRMYTYLQKIACAGTGFCFDDIPYETIEAPLVDGADFIIGVNGDSMEPEYHDGDKLYVKRVEHLQIDEVGIFTIGNECFLKKLGEDGLISLNPEYKNILGNEDIRLVGKVIGKFSE